MLFALTGFFRAGVDTSPAALQAGFNEHFAQLSRHIYSAGAIHDRNGQRIGWLTLMEADDFDDAQAYIRESPYYGANLYDRVEVGRYAPEVGALDLRP